MTSILNTFESDQSNSGLSTGPVKSPQAPGPDWDSLRSVSNSVYQQRSTKIRTALLVLLLIVALGTGGLILHNHMPALVSFGEGLGQTVYRFASSSPTASAAMHPGARPDLRRPAHRRSTEGRIPAVRPELTPDPAFRPFYATTVIKGRRVPLISNNDIIVLDVAKGTWTFASELE